MPPGTLGFRASGKITGDEYRKMWSRSTRRSSAVTTLNIYFELADDFHRLDLGALWQDVQAASGGATDLYIRGPKTGRAEPGAWS